MYTYISSLQFRSINCQFSFSPYQKFNIHTMSIKILSDIQYIFEFSQLSPNVKYSFSVLYRIQLKTQYHKSCCLFKSSNVDQVLSFFCLSMTLAFLKHLGQLSCKTFLHILLINQSYCFRLYLQYTHIHHLLKKNYHSSDF